MTLDVIVPTYNRSHLLRAAIASLMRASVPAGLAVRVIVVDNNSTDDTRAVVAEMQANAPLPLIYLLETQQGSSRARNAGINASTAGLLGFIDNDEEVDAAWFQVIAREFADATLDYIGGCVLPNWVSPEPDWLPPGYHSVIGAIPPKARAPFDGNFPGILMGGNCVLRRSVFERVGLYDPRLGRSGKGLLSEEDAEFYRRLQAASLRGMYVPDLAIFHHIDPERLTRSYHRRWAYWRAVSQGISDRDHREPVAYLLGIPRHRIGRALRSLIAMPGHMLERSGRGRAFADELATWDLIGFIYGKHFARVERLYAANQ